MHRWYNCLCVSRTWSRLCIKGSALSAFPVFFSGPEFCDKSWTLSVLTIFSRVWRRHCNKDRTLSVLPVFSRALKRHCSKVCSISVLLIVSRVWLWRRYCNKSWTLSVLPVFSRAWRRLPTTAWFFQHCHCVSGIWRRLCDRTLTRLLIFFFLMPSTA